MDLLPAQTGCGRRWCCLRPRPRKGAEAAGAKERLQPEHTPCPNRKQDTSPPSRPPTQKHIHGKSTAPSAYPVLTGNRRTPAPPPQHTHKVRASRRFTCHCHQGQAQRLGQTLLTPPGTQRHSPVTASPQSCVDWGTRESAPPAKVSGPGDPSRCH